MSMSDGVTLTTTNSPTYQRNDISLSRNASGNLVWLDAVKHFLRNLSKPAFLSTIRSHLVGQGHLPSAVTPETLAGLLVQETKKPGSLLKVLPGLLFTVVPSPASAMQASNERYRHRYKKLRKLVREMTFVNAAVCDEIVRMEEQIQKARDERSFLLRKLLQYQTVNELASLVSQAQAALVSPSQVPPGGSTGLVSSGSLAKEKKKHSLVDDIGTSKSKKHKREATAKKFFVQQIPLDDVGRPLFPIVVDGLTVHSLGEIVHDRQAFHTEQHIYPVGFCSSRTFDDVKNLGRKCLYTCKILDGGEVPRFEIVPESSPETLVMGFTAQGCLNELLRIINASRKEDQLEFSGQGEDFFGFAHPTIQNLIQSCPGARKCSSYKWTKFKVCKFGRDPGQTIAEDSQQK
ncbi:PREDICTED: transforming growth factor beta regulator 1-like isoform X2 [Priapulus caudatus]|uniref:Transforming growth factor beta regulator 1-like isoform X2 n=1 Tax=Priapulus caudatus TaxID=37621 RepID=A0ABM1DPU5_PRICU|nr:PREDICTED: transforming growth factor beta regulator 1-like isoform X2 [Priapulus caudatus]